MKKITVLLESNQSTIARCLVGMCQLEIVIPRQDGQSVYYSLGNPKILESFDLMHQVLLEYLEGKSNFA